MSKDSKIGDLHDRLDSRNSQPRQKERVDVRPKAYKVPHNWKDTTPVDQDITMTSRKKKAQSSSLVTKIFFASIAFFVIAVVFAAFSLAGDRSTVSGKNILVEISGKGFVDGGEEYTLQVHVTNTNTAPLELADLILEYPQGSFADTNDVARKRVALGGVDVGETVTEDFSIALFGEEGDEQEIKATLEYRIEKSNAIFVKESSLPVVIRSTPIELSITAPETTVSNQEMELAFEVFSNSQESIENGLLRLEYPPGFEFISSAPIAGGDNNVWQLGTINPGQRYRVEVTGVLKGQHNENRTLRAIVGTQHSRNPENIKTVLNSSARVIGITESFIAASIAFGGSGAFAPISSNDFVDGEINWVNTLPERLTNVRFILRLGGSAYDNTKVREGTGFFDSSDGTILWEEGAVAELATLEPGERGSFDFEIGSRSLASVGSVISEPEISLVLDIEGIDASGNIRSVLAVDEETLRVNSNLNLVTQTLYHSGPFVNIGPVPPRVGQTTTYTIGWEVSNTSNSTSGTTVATRLPSYVEWIGETSPGEDITYNAVDREVTWDLGTVAKGAGFSTDSREAFFKIAIVPSSTQIGSVPELTDELVLQGRDNFTNVILRGTKRAHGTRLLNDTSSVGATGRVEP